jgi:hypothetical protein
MKLILAIACACVFCCTQMSFALENPSSTKLSKNKSLTSTKLDSKKSKTKTTTQKPKKSQIGVKTDKTIKN